MTFQFNVVLFKNLFWILLLIRYCFSFYGLCFGSEACEILAPLPESNNPLHWRLNLNCWATRKAPAWSPARPIETSLPSSPFIVLEHGWSIFSFYLFFHMGAWNAFASPPYALPLFYLVMEEREGDMFEVYFQGSNSSSSKQVYFVIQSEYIHFLGVFLHCHSSSLLAILLLLLSFGVCFSLLAQVCYLIHHHSDVAFSAGHTLLFRIVQPLDCWTQFSFCALSWNISVNNKILSFSGNRITDCDSSKK